MALLSLNDVTVGYGGPPLLENITLQIEAGERIGLLGRNGTGKSTLLKLITGQVDLTEGEVIRAPDAHIAQLAQDVPHAERCTIREVVCQGLGHAGDLLAEFHRLSAQLGDAATPQTQRQLDDVQEKLNAIDGWHCDQQVDQVLSRMQLDPQIDFSTLSAGMKRRVLLAKSLVREPDLLLLDEPTNHLDIESIRWLEDFLSRFRGTLIFVTHDRTFLQKLATRIIEIDRGGVFDWTCNYETFLVRKQEALEAQQKQEELFDKKLAEEEKWIRQGIKARRTRNEGRVRALKKLREERQARRAQIGKVKMDVQEGTRSGNLVIVADGLNFSYDSNPIVSNFSTKMLRGDRIGLIGPNGSGKTTLLRLLLGENEPDSGTVQHGTKLQVAYFDQVREQIVEEKTVEENVGEGTQDLVLPDGSRRHIIGYLQDFLFTPERSRSPARFLSGGERNRLLLAKLFTKPANLLVLDEPTNDLDLETLELLEELLLNYTGTLLLVSHDRTFLNNVVTSTIAFDSPGVIREYAGGYDDWLRQRQQAEQVEADNKPVPKSKPVTAPKSKPKKLSFKEQQELDALPFTIEELETEQAQRHEQMADPAFYQNPGDVIAAAKAELEEIESQLAVAYERWETLEARANGESV